MISPESIDLAILPSIALCDRALLPSVPAIYFCLSESGEVLYIGKSVCPSERCYCHHRHTELETIGKVRLAWLLVENINMICSIESALIYYFKPRLNQTKGHPYTSMAQLRERAGLRTVDVASKIGVGESSVRNWEKGRTIPKLRIDQIGDLIRLYGCSFEEFEQAIKNTKTEVGVTDVSQ